MRTFVCVALTLLLAAQARAQDAVDPDVTHGVASDVERLDAWLTLHAHRSEEARLVSGVIAIALGGIELPVEAVITAVVLA